MTAEAIIERIERFGITRLCHLTPFRNLVHIATGGDGLLSLTQLSEVERSEFTQQDRERLDEHPDHISCSVEFPNAWYLRQRRRNARGEDKNFPDWVVLEIPTSYLQHAETLFCHRNAAGGRGQFLRSGIEGLDGMYDEEVIGAGGQTFRRSDLRLKPCPTDDQAEVMVHRQVTHEDIGKIFVGDAAQAARTYVGLEQAGADPDFYEYVIAPAFFSAYQLSGLIARGERPDETTWDPPAK